MPFWVLSFGRSSMRYCCLIPVQLGRLDRQLWPALEPAPMPDWMGQVQQGLMAGLQLAGRLPGPVHWPDLGGP